MNDLELNLKARAEIRDAAAQIVGLVVTEMVGKMREEAKRAAPPLEDLAQEHRRRRQEQEQIQMAQVREQEQEQRQTERIARLVRENAKLESRLFNVFQRSSDLRRRLDLLTEASKQAGNLTPLNSLSIPDPLRATLEADGVTFVEILTHHRPEDVLAIRNIGHGRLAIIRDALAGRGLHLRDDDQDDER